MHPVTLAFPDKVEEEEFRKRYLAESQVHIQFAILLGLLLIAGFGVLDLILQPTVVRELWTIRYGIMTPVWLGALAVTFRWSASRLVEWSLVVMILTAGWGITAMILISPEPGRHFYYAGLILAIMYVFTFLKMRFARSSLVGWSLVASYLIGELTIGHPPWAYLTSNLFFFVSATVIGMFAAYFLESLARKNFLQAKQVKQAREFGSYRLVAKLGQGGMGEVWRAEHYLLARPAAIKLIRPDVLGSGPGDESTLKRFEREAQATALLRSPHTVELYDFGVTEEGTFYYVMELLEGFNLHTLVQWFGPVASPRAVHFLIQACDSLGEAHSRNLVHRDVKPANILTCRYGREVDFVKILDFGLVKRSSTARMSAQEKVDHDQSGTPSCMAPEQINGHATDARTDIYGLACVGYWLLTGRNVFEADTTGEVMAHHQKTTPTPPSKRTELAVPPALDDIIMACLEKNPDDRPQSADALAQILREESVSSAWSPEDALSWWKENTPDTREDAPLPEVSKTITPSLVLR